MITCYHISSVLTHTFFHIPLFMFHTAPIKVSESVCAHSLSRAQLFATPCTVAHQAHLSMRFLRQESWNELPLPPPGDLLRD